MKRQTTEYRDLLIQARKTARFTVNSLCNQLDRRLMDWEDYAQEGVLKLLEVEKNEVTPRQPQSVSQHHRAELRACRSSQEDSGKS